MRLGSAGSYRVRLLALCIVVGAGGGAAARHERTGSATPPRDPVDSVGEGVPGSRPLRQTEWAIDGAAFVYTSRASGDAELWLRSGSGAQPVNLTNDPSQDHWASWFPDGDRIAFQTQRDGNREVYVMGADGSTPTNLTNNPAQDLLPEVSPDGRRIAFFSDRGIAHGPGELPGHIFVMDVDGGNPERLTEEPLTSSFFGAWSPDGDALVFARDFGGNVDLVVIDIDSREETRLSGTIDSEFGGRFSPDGERIAFAAAATDGEARIVVVDVSGGNRVELTAGAQHYDPVWSPDGSWLMFSGAPLGESQFDLLMVGAAGGPVSTLLATEVDERTGSWRPYSSRSVSAGSTASTRRAGR